jgi:hypothetical protein
MPDAAAFDLDARSRKLSDFGARHRGARPGRRRVSFRPIFYFALLTSYFIEVSILN